ncbi:MAG: hypothetical protein MI923_13605 [Phycisphaerales bacterium]|nr:hypothetical protein [Phycisphaerales bacterium]
MRPRINDGAQVRFNQATSLATAVSIAALAKGAAVNVFILASCALGFQPPKLDVEGSNPFARYESNPLGRGLREIPARLNPLSLRARTPL